MSKPLHEIAWLRLLSAKCSRLANDLDQLYHKAVRVGVQDETLEAVVRLRIDVSAIHNRVDDLRYPTEAAT
jgi:hypothetical protein